MEERWALEKGRCSSEASAVRASALVTGFLRGSSWLEM
jgi:hypothetical protein